MSDDSWDDLISLFIAMAVLIGLLFVGMPENIGCVALVLLSIWIVIELSEKLQVVKNVWVWVARRKLCWQMPIVTTTIVGISVWWVALYKMIILGNISATWIEDVGISCLIGFTMAFGGGMILDIIVGDEFTRRGQDE